MWLYRRILGQSYQRRGIGMNEEGKRADEHDQKKETWISRAYNEQWNHTQTLKIHPSKNSTWKKNIMAQELEDMVFENNLRTNIRTNRYEEEYIIVKQFGYWFGLPPLVVWRPSQKPCTALKVDPWSVMWMGKLLLLCDK